MKSALSFIALTLLLSTSVHAKIFTTKKAYFIETSQGTAPLMSVNQMLKEKKISKIKTYGDGSAHLISFAVKKGPVKLYSVDAKGFIYSIEPFTSYSVSSLDENGKFQFKEVPGRKYVVDSKGFFLY